MPISSHSLRRWSSVSAAAFLFMGIASLGVATSSEAASPYVLLSSYAGHPGSAVSLHGHMFQPHQVVTVNFEGMSKQVTADANGNFSSAAFTVPHRPAGSYALSAGGQSAPFYIHGYYPQIDPSSYYVSRGTTFDVHGRDFAPGEPVELFVAGQKVATQNADGGGHVHFTATAPVMSGSFDVRAAGLHSGQSSMRTITIAWQA